MAGKLLFISDISNSFYLNSIITNLEKRGFESELADFNPDMLQGFNKDVAAYFLFLGKDARARDEVALSYLNNICGERHKKVFLCGEKEDLAQMPDVIDKSFIADIFVRPLNAGSVTDRIVNFMDQASKMDNRKEILLVDDSGTVLHTMKSWLEPTYRVQIVSSASNAFTYLSKHRPDLILLDYDMPVCDGPKFLEMLRTDDNYASIPVMFLTGKGDKESIQSVLSLKPQGYLLKTLPKNKILEALRDFF